MLQSFGVAGISVRLFLMACCVELASCVIAGIVCALADRSERPNEARFVSGVLLAVVAQMEASVAICFHCMRRALVLSSRLCSRAEAVGALRWR